MAWIAYIASGIVVLLAQYTLTQIATGLGIMAGGAAGALFLWKRFLYPLIQSINLAGEALPFLREFVEAFKDRPGVFKMLAGVSDQFKTDSGSSLKDQMNRLEGSTIKAEAAVARAEQSVVELKTDREVQRRLAEQSQQTMERLMKELDRVSVIVTAGAAAAKVVASDLAHAHARADATEGDPGAAADAAVTGKEG